MTNTYYSLKVNLDRKNALIESRFILKYTHVHMNLDSNTQWVYLNLVFVVHIIQTVALYLDGKYNGELLFTLCLQIKNNPSVIFIN